MSDSHTRSTDSATNPRPSEPEPSPYWTRTPEKLDEFDRYRRLAATDRLRTYWSEHWVFGDYEEPPFPFIVDISTFDEANNELLRRLDEIGLPYHINYYPEFDGKAPTHDPEIYAPLWNKSGAGLDGQEDGRIFHDVTEYPEEPHRYEADRPLETFFNCFRARE